MIKFSGQKTQVELYCKSEKKKGKGKKTPITVQKYIYVRLIIMI